MDYRELYQESLNDCKEKLSTYSGEIKRANDEIKKEQLKSAKRVKVLRNVCHANHPIEDRRLKCNDIVLVHQVGDNDVIWYKVKTVLNYIPLSDVEVIE